MLDYNHSTATRFMRDYGWNLEKTVQAILDEGLRPNAKNIMVFVNFDGFFVSVESGEQLMVRVGGQKYLLFVESADNLRYAGDVRVKYWSEVQKIFVDPSAAGDFFCIKKIPALLRRDWMGWVYVLLEYKWAWSKVKKPAGNDDRDALDNADCVEDCL